MIPTEIQPQYEIRRHRPGALAYNAGTPVAYGDYDKCLQWLLNVMPHLNRLSYVVFDYLMWETHNGKVRHVQPFPEGYTSVRPTVLGDTMTFEQLEQISAANRGSQERGIAFMAEELRARDQAAQTQSGATSNHGDESAPEQ